MIAVLAALAMVAPNCATIKMHLTRAHAKHRVEQRAACGGNLTPHVFVNGQELLVADLDNPSTATFYGQGTVVRLHQRGDRISVRASTVNRHERVRVRFERG